MRNPLPASASPSDALGLLRTHGKWPRRRTAEKRDEFASPHGRPHGSRQGIVAVHMRLVKGGLDVRFGPIADIAPTLLNDLVGNSQYAGRNAKPERFCCFEIDNEVEFG